MNANQALDDIDRIHDDEPQRAADGLRSLDLDALGADRLPTLAFLLNHVLGEKLGLWREAAEQLQTLHARRADAPLAVAAQAAVAAELSGASRGAAFAALVDAGGATAAEIATWLGGLGFAAPANVVELATQLAALAARVQSIAAPNPLDQRLAAGFNNATSQLLDLTGPPIDPQVNSALVAGSAAALHFWRRAGTWVQHERALYLRALVQNRIGEPAAARDACTEALAIIEANGGGEDIDRVFLQLQLAAALLRLKERAAGERLLAEAKAAAAAWDDAGLKSWFAEELGKLFDGATESAR